VKKLEKKLNQMTKEEEQYKKTMEGELLNQKQQLNKYKKLYFE